MWLFFITNRSGVASYNSQRAVNTVGAALINKLAPQFLKHLQIYFSLQSQKHIGPLKVSGS